MNLLHSSAVYASGVSSTGLGRSHWGNNFLWSTWRFPGNASRPQSKLDADRIAELERKIEQQAMEIEFFKKALRRFREHPLPVVGNGNVVSISRSGKRPTRGQR